MNNNPYRRFFLGFDNGISATVAIIGYHPEHGHAVHNFKIPVKSEQNYTKVAKNITRVDGPKLFWELKNSIPEGSEVHIMIERPFVNPKMFQASLSAIRALEAVQIVLDTLGYGYVFVDSKQWQKELLPKGTKGPDLKEKSLQVGQRLYPGKLVKGHKDADGLLIAHYCMLKNK